MKSKKKSKEYRSITVFAKKISAYHIGEKRNCPSRSRMKVETTPPLYIKYISRNRGLGPE